MAVNVEIKARIADLTRVRDRASRLASGPSQIIVQTDTFFVVPSGRLKVREFADGSAELIGYERADRTGPKTSSYARASCPDGHSLVDALSRALRSRGVVKKRRELFMVGRTRIHLDEVEGLGSFLELEVVLAPGESVESGMREARDLLTALDVPDSALIAQAYIDLIERPA